MIAHLAHLPEDLRAFAHARLDREREADRKALGLPADLALEALRRRLPEGWNVERLGRRFRVWRTWEPGASGASFVATEDDAVSLARGVR